MNILSRRYSTGHFYLFMVLILELSCEKSTSAGSVLTDVYFVVSPGSKRRKYAGALDQADNISEVSSQNSLANHYPAHQVIGESTLFKVIV